VLVRHDLTPAIQDLEDARARGGRPLRHAERDAEHPHRPDEHQDQRVERHELTDRE